MSVFVIINEWTDISGNTSSEVVAATYFETEGDAWEALRIIGQTHEYELPFEYTSITLEDHVPNLQSEEYYIEELNKQS